MSKIRLYAFEAFCTDRRTGARHRETVVLHDIKPYAHSGRRLSFSKEIEEAFSLLGYTVDNLMFSGIREFGSDLPEIYQKVIGDFTYKLDLGEKDII